MNTSNDKLIKRRLRSSYVTSFISISLVLFLFGLVVLLVLNARYLSNYVKENIGFTVILDSNIKEVEILRFQKKLDASDFVRVTEFISKEDAADVLKEYLGEDFETLLGYNPLLSSIDVKLKAAYANNDSIAKIEKQLLSYPQIKELSYQKNLIQLVNDNIKKISLGLLILSSFLFVITFTLINNTIRLSIYSKRFIINTMKLVGATEKFIRKPFLLQGVLYGIIGGIFASVLLVGAIYFVLKEFNTLINVNYIGLLLVVVVGMGVAVTSTSTVFAVNKFLRINPDDLYF